MTFVCAPLSGRLVGSRGPAAPAADRGHRDDGERGAVRRVRGRDVRTPLLFTGYVLFGIGFGLVNAPITNTAVSGMPRAQAGVAAAVASTSRQIGQTLGVAVIGAVLAAGVGLLVVRGHLRRAAPPGLVDHHRVRLRSWSAAP